MCNVIDLSEINRLVHIDFYIIITQMGAGDQLLSSLQLQTPQHQV